MRCKILLVLLVVLVFVISCAPQELSDEELEKKLSNLSDQELMDLVKEGDENGAIAGQAYYNVKYGASNSKVLEAAKKIMEKKIPKSEVPLPEITINSPPVLNPIGNKQVQKGSLLTFAVSATDANNDPLVYSAQVLPLGANFNANLQTFNWVPAYNQVGINQITFKVSDGKKEDEETINITVLDSVVLNSCVPKPNGLVSWWDGDKVNGATAYDLVGTHHGTLANGAKIGNGMVGNAFDFSGNSGYVGVPHNADFNIGYNWFIDAWIMPLSYPAPGKRGVILMKWVDGGENKALEIGSDGKIFVTLVNVQKQSAQVYSTTNLLMNRFTFVAASYNGTALNLYINGILDNSMPLSIDVSDSTGVLYMGHHPARGLEFVPFDGLIDEVEWGKEAPTEQKIMELFSSSSTGKCK